jgi:uncharacterized membrane protein YphA (DoxX/SURF4 family)
MKVTVVIARVLLGLLFAVFGFNKIVIFLPVPMPRGEAGAMMLMMYTHKWLLFYGCVETVSGVLLLAGRFVPLALTLLAGMITNILLFDITFGASELPVGLLAGLLEVFLVYAYRASFAGIFAAKAQPAGFGVQSRSTASSSPLQQAGGDAR